MLKNTNDTFLFFFFGKNLAIRLEKTCTKQILKVKKGEKNQIPNLPFIVNFIKKN